VKNGKEYAESVRQVIRKMRVLPFFFLTLVSSLALSQQNLIFAGGEDEGYDLKINFSLLNNSIYSGGDYDGWSSTLVFESLNSNIFNGGDDQGFNSSKLEFQQYNNIFGGGGDDGYVEERAMSTINNQIYFGGIDDGISNELLFATVNNSLFGGGRDDGFYALKLEGILLDCVKERYLSGLIPMGTYQAAERIIATGQVSSGEAYLLAGNALEFGPNFEVTSTGEVTALMEGCKAEKTKVTKLDQPSSQ